MKRIPPKWVVNTHDHEDHIGANRPIQERFGINIYATPDEEITGDKANALEAAERNKGIMESCDTEGRKWWL